MNRAERARHAVDELLEEFPDWDISLDYGDRWQLLVATILSAQCTDEMVNRVTPELFEAYPTVEAMAEADQDHVEELVHSTGFYRQKAQRLIGSARMILDEHDGEVPETMDGLTELPGVARKTANVVLHHGFAKREGIAVDTHVQRISRRLGLTGRERPERIEEELMDLFPREDWTRVTHLFIEHGRQTCDARNPRCTECRLLDVCPSGEELIEAGEAASA